MKKVERQKEGEGWTEGGGRYGERESGKAEVSIF